MPAAALHSFRPRTQALGLLSAALADRRSRPSSTSPHAAMSTPWLSGDANVHHSGAWESFGEPPPCLEDCGYTRLRTVTRYGHVDVGVAASRRGDLVDHIRGPRRSGSTTNPPSDS